MKHPVRWIAVLLVAVAIVGELALRRAGYGGRLLTEPSARFGWVRIPNQRFHIGASRSAGINSMGYRDREWKPSGSEEQEARLLRVAILGNSLARTDKQIQEESFAPLLESALRERLGPRGDDAIVMNFSSHGYTVEQSVRVYEDHIRPFRPDAVVLLVNAHSPRPMVEAKDPRQFPLRRTLMLTAFYDYYQRELAVWETPGTVHPKNIKDPQKRASALRAKRLAEMIRSQPFSDECLELWVSMEDRLSGMASDLAGRDGVLVLAHVPRIHRLLRLYPSRTGETVARLSRWAHRRDGTFLVDLAPQFLETCGDLIEEIVSGEYEPHVVWRRLNNDQDLVRSLKHGNQTPYFFDNPEHLTPGGHALVAAGLADVLETIQLRGPRNLGRRAAGRKPR